MVRHCYAALSAHICFLGDIPVYCGDSWLLRLLCSIWVLSLQFGLQINSHVTSAFFGQAIIIVSLCHVLTLGPELKKMRSALLWFYVLCYATSGYRVEQTVLLE